MSGEKKGCSCIGKGCIVMVVIAALFIAGIFWVYQKAVVWMRSHTSSKPTAVAVEKTTPDQYDALVKKLDAFKNAPPAGTHTLELTAHDLNVLIAFSPEWKAVRGKITASIAGDELTLAGSLPLSYVPQLRSQFMNGSIRFNLSMEHYALLVDIRGVKLNEGELSGTELKAFSDASKTYLGNTLLGDPVLKPILVKAKTLSIKDGVIVLTSE